MSGQDTDPRPYKCPFPDCTWSFARFEHQVRHMRTHSSERRFVCEHIGCTSKFARNDELKRHERLMHPPTSTRYEAALADDDQVVYFARGRRQAGQDSTQRSTALSGHAHSGSYYRASHYQHPSPSSSRGQLPPQPATSMNNYSLSGYARELPPLPSSRIAQPSPLRQSRVGASFMPPSPATPVHPPLPVNYRPPTAGRRSHSPIILPPLRTNRDGYSTDSGRRERPVRLPGFSEIASQARFPNSSRR